MIGFGWMLIALGAVFAAITVWQLHTGRIVDRSTVTIRAKEPRTFLAGELFIGCYATALIVAGVIVLVIA